MSKTNMTKNPEPKKENRNKMHKNNKICLNNVGKF